MASRPSERVDRAFLKQIVDDKIARQQAGASPPTLDRSQDAQFLGLAPLGHDGNATGEMTDDGYVVSAKPMSWGQKAWYDITHPVSQIINPIGERLGNADRSARHDISLSPVSSAYGLNEQIGGTNQFGRFDLDAPPQAIADLRKRYPQIAQVENEIWNKSQGSWSFDTEFPFLHHKLPREFGLVAYKNNKDAPLLVDRLYPALNPKTGNSDMIALPQSVLKTGRFTRPGYTPVMIEHTHPIPYSFGNQIGRGYIRGPSRPDFNTSYANPNAVSVVQALANDGSRQFFYFGPKIYPK